jgi:hypothetical protein
VLHPIVSGSTAGGVGILLPLFFVCVLLFALGIALVRRHRIAS